MTDHNEKAKLFLEKQLAEYETKIKKLKKKRKIIKPLYATVIVISVSCSGVCATLAAFTVPVFITALQYTGRSFPSRRCLSVCLSSQREL